METSKPEDWRDPARRQNIALRLDDAIRSYPGTLPSHMSNGSRGEEAVFQKAKSKEEYNRYVERLLLALTRHRTMGPQPAMQPAYQPQPGMQSQTFLPGTRQPHPPSQPHPSQPHPSQQSYYQQHAGMGAGHPHPSPAQAHIQTGGPSYGPAGYPGQIQQHRPQMMGGAGMPPRNPIVYTPSRAAVPVLHHPGMLPGHSPSPTHPEMGGVGSPAQPTAHSGMYNQPHASPHSAVQQPILPRPGGPHPSGGPHPPGPSPGMLGLSPAMAPSPSNQAPPSVQSHEEAQEYDRKVKELMQYVPVMERMIDSLMRNVREADNPSMVEQTAKLKLFISALQDPERRLPMNMLDKWREALIKAPLPRQARDTPDRPLSTGGPSGVPTTQPAPVLELEPGSPPPSHAKLFAAVKRPHQEFQEVRFPAKFRKVAFRQTLETALAKGSVEVEIVKCVTFGPPEAGKTQLKSALIGTFDCSEESTPMSTGAEVIMQRYIEGVSSWEPLTRDRLCKSIHTTVTGKFEESVFSGAIDTHSHAGEVLASGVEQEGTRAFHGDRAEGKMTLQEQFSALYASVKVGLVETDPGPKDVKGLQNVRMIHLIDSGGQPAFFDVHPVIATSRAVYLLVYNMEEGLDAKPRITYRRKGFPTKELPNEKQSNLDMIKDSLLILHDCKQKFIMMEEELCKWFGNSISDSVEGMPTLVVGSRKKEDSIAVEGNKLNTECKHLPIWDEVLHCTETGMKLFPVDSMDKDCPGLQSVREAINEAECLFKLRLPIAWFFCQLIFWSANEDLHVLTYANLQDLCLQENIIADGVEFRAMIRTFHLLGIFSFPYFDQEILLGDQWEPDDKPVFTNPDILYREVTKILEVAFRHLEKTKMNPIQRKSLIALQRNGRFSTSTLDHLNIPDQLGSYRGFQSYLLERLVQWGLAATLTSGTSHGTADVPTPDYFIPSVLTTCNKEPCNFTKSPIPELAYTFCISHAGSVCNYVPQGMFPHLIIRADGMGYIIPQSADCLFRNAAVLTTEAAPSGYAYNVMVMDRKDRVTIKIDPAHDCKDRFSWDDCRRIVCDFKKAMEAAYYGIYLTPHEVTVGCECQCKKALPSHLAEIIHCPDGHCVMQCLIPTVTWRGDCPEAVAELYPQGPGQMPTSEGDPFTASTTGDAVVARRQAGVTGPGQMPTSEDGPSPASTGDFVVDRRQAGVTGPGQRAANGGTAQGQPQVPAAPFVASEFLEKYEEEFFSDVNVKQSLQRLVRKGVISDVVKKKIEDESDKQEAKETLFNHLSRRATTATLREWCEVAIAANGYPKMQELGKKMKAALP